MCSNELTTDTIRCLHNDTADELCAILSRTCCPPDIEEWTRAPGRYRWIITWIPSVTIFLDLLTERAAADVRACNGLPPGC